MSISTYKRSLYAGGFIVALAAAGSTQLFDLGKSHAETSKQAAPVATPVSVAIVQPKLITRWSEFSGRLEAIDHVELRSRVAGAIQSVAFKEGALVKQGDLLVKIDPAPYEAEVARAKAAVSAAESKLSFAKNELERGKRLIDSRTVSQSDYDQRSNVQSGAQADLEAAQAGLKTAMLNLGYTEIRAPISGRVGRIEITAGNLIASGPSSPLLTTIVSIDLPVRLAEFGNVHRYEPSGALHGLMRVRGFTQDDAHVFCTDEQMAAECLRINDLILSVYKDFGFDEITIKLSTRPEKRVGSDALWDRAESVMMGVLEQIQQQSNDIKTGILPGEGAFYGPKFEYTLKDAIGREWQCGTTQVDFNLPERFGAFYIDSTSEKKQPVMIHRAICGSMERFLGILIENFAGHLPLWFAPVQVVVATITTEADDYGRQVAKELKAAGLQVITDFRNEKINYKVREHSLQKVPVILVCGMREAEERTVNMRRLGSQNQTSLSLDDAIRQLGEEATPPDLLRAAAQ